MNNFSFENLKIERIIAHTIFARKTDKTLVQPQTSDHLIPLDRESKDLIQTRITEALGSASHGIEVSIAKKDHASFMQQAARMLRMNEPEFIIQSKQLALDLATAQTNPRWPAGVLIILSGQVGANQKPFLAAIKAETDQGFNIEEKNGAVNLTLIKKMLLSQTQRLYKIGMLIEINFQKPTEAGYASPNYRSFLFDHLLTSTETRQAAAYFYDTFLGMDIISSSKYLTRSFYENTRSFVNGLPIEQDQKNELLESLRAELRSNKQTLSIAEFAKDHLPAEHTQAYCQKMKEDGLPENAIIKDIDYIKAKLRRPRRMTFTTGIKIHVPADIEFNEHLKITNQEGEYTSVRIKGILEERE